MDIHDIIVIAVALTLTILGIYCQIQVAKDSKEHNQIEKEA